MPMNSQFLHCMWSDQKSRLSLTRACEFAFFFSRVDQSGTIWTLLGPVLIPCGLVDHLDPSCLICGPVFDYCWTVAHLWIFVDQW